MTELEIKIDIEGDVVESIQQDVQRLIDNELEFDFHFHRDYLGPGSLPQCQLTAVKSGSGCDDASYVSRKALAVLERLSACVKGLEAVVANPSDYWCMLLALKFPKLVVVGDYEHMRRIPQVLRKTDVLLDQLRLPQVEAASKEKQRGTPAGKPRFKAYCEKCHEKMSVSAKRKGYRHLQCKKCGHEDFPPIT